MLWEQEPTAFFYNSIEISRTLFFGKYRDKKENKLFTLIITINVNPFCSHGHCINNSC